MWIAKSNIKSIFGYISISLIVPWLFSKYITLQSAMDTSYRLPPYRFRVDSLSKARLEDKGQIDAFVLKVHFSEHRLTEPMPHLSDAEQWRAKPLPLADLPPLLADWRRVSSPL